MRLSYVIGVNPEVAQEYGLTGYPTASFIGREGVIVSLAPGLRPRRELETDVRKML